MARARVSAAVGLTSSHFMQNELDGSSGWRWLMRRFLGQERNSTTGDGAGITRVPPQASAPGTFLSSSLSSAANLGP